ncbi:MAG: hypothetical protein LBJ72_04735, partial [Dysgonamonadaceae bacterium]|nr:hypothetical protein [Dysgonamonadaceae bacterium]
MTTQNYNHGGATIDAAGTNAQTGQNDRGNTRIPGDDRTGSRRDAMHRVSTIAIALICLLAPFAATTAYAANIVISNQSDWDALRASPNTIADDDVIQLNADVTGGLTITSATVTSLTIDGGGTGHSIAGGIYFTNAINLTLNNLTVHPDASSVGADALHLAGGGTLTTTGTVVLTGGDGTSSDGGHGVSSYAGLTVTASD